MFTCFQLHETEMPTVGRVIPSSAIKGTIKEGAAVQAK